jgi:hypothetical protein
MIFLQFSTRGWFNYNLYGITEAFGFTEGFRKLLNWNLDYASQYQ